MARTPRLLTAAERKKPVTVAAVREVLGRAPNATTEAERRALFDRALAAVEDLDEDERERLLVLVMEALDLARE